MLILCDFDNTITAQDVTNLIWDRYYRPDWREVLLPPYRRNEFDSVELMDRGYRPVKASAEEMLAFVRPQIGYRAGFQDFVAVCRARGWALHVASCGLEWYIRDYLPEGIPVHALDSKQTADGWKVGLPPHVTLAPGQDYKIWILARLKEQHPGREVVFIGDGRNDFAASKLSDRVFAVKGSTLEELCREAGIAHTTFEGFEEIVKALG